MRWVALVLTTAISALGVVGCGGDDRRRNERARSRDDVAVANWGIEHALVSEGGVTFVEALAPVLRDHVPTLAKLSSILAPAWRASLRDTKQEP